MGNDKVIDVEVTEKDTKTENKEEKKEGFFSKLKKKVNDAQLENNIKQAFGKANEEYVFYTGNGLLNSTSFDAENHEDLGYVIVFGEDRPKMDNTLVCARKREDVYKITSIEETTVDVKLEGEVYNRKAFKVNLGAKAEKVNVVKVEGDYYLL
jgi:hypothetical protein